MMSLANETPMGAAGNIVEGAAVTYWLNKVAKGDIDPEQSKGRVGGAVYVRNNREYAGVAGGQLVGAHIFMAILCKLLLVPWFIFSFFLMVILPGMVLMDTNKDWSGTPHPGLLAGLALCACFLIWAYVAAWRMCLKPLIKFLFKHGPKIVPADGYQGPLGSTPTTNITTILPPKWVEPLPTYPSPTWDESFFRMTHPPQWNPNWSDDQMIAEIGRRRMAGHVDDLMTEDEWNQLGAEGTNRLMDIEHEYDRLNALESVA